MCIIPRGPLSYVMIGRGNRDRPRAFDAIVYTTDHRPLILLQEVVYIYVGEPHRVNSVTFLCNGALLQSEKAP